MVYILLTIFILFLLNAVLTFEQYFVLKVKLYCFLTVLIAISSLLFPFYRIRIIQQLNLIPNLLRSEKIIFKEPTHLIFKYLITAIFFFCLWLAWQERLVIINHAPIVPYTADMLPVIDAAIEKFLAVENPYGTYFMPWPVHLTYLPLF